MCMWSCLLVCYLCSTLQVLRVTTPCSVAFELGKIFLCHVFIKNSNIVDFLAHTSASHSVSIWFIWFYPLTRPKPPRSALWRHTEAVCWGSSGDAGCRGGQTTGRFPVRIPYYELKANYYFCFFLWLSCDGRLDRISYQKCIKHVFGIWHFIQIFTRLIFSNVLILVVEHFSAKCTLDEIWIKTNQPLVRWKVIYCG